MTINIIGLVNNLEKGQTKTVVLIFPKIPLARSGSMCESFGTPNQESETMSVASAERVSPPIKWHGGKHYLAAKIVALMPQHVHYVEPFAGGLSVLLAKDPEGVSEVVNDLNGSLINFWSVLRCPDRFEAFHRLCEATPFSESIWLESAEMNGSSVERAWRFFVRCRQSLAGRMDSFAAISRSRVRRGMNEQTSAWLTAIEGLSDVHHRLRRVLILSRPALKVIQSEDSTDTLQYLDPPYLHQTRAIEDVYQYEMTNRDHVELLDTIRQCKGKILISGYPSEMYDSALKNWNRVEFKLPNQAAAGKTKRRMVEVVWFNFASIRPRPWGHGE